MNYNYKEFEDESSDNILSRISNAVVELKQADLKIAEAEEVLREAQEVRRHIAEDLLPGLMDEAQQTEITTKDGTKVKVEERIRASIPEAMKGKAFAWLKQNGHDSLIKNQFIIDFGRDQEQFAQEFEQYLKEEWEEAELNYKRKSDIHNMTLVSFIKEQLGEGVPLPLDVFGVYRQRFVKVK